jgi:hypothetical protein
VVPVSTVVLATDSPFVVLSEAVVIPPVKVEVAVEVATTVGAVRKVPALIPAAFKSPENVLVAVLVAENDVAVMVSFTVSASSMSAVLDA